MIVKAEIQSIDYGGNTCVVRMPTFESSAGGDLAIAPAIISNAPGVYNGYKEGDIVLVAFENGQMQTPCVIGKLYLGADAEGKEARGSINCSALKAKISNSLPISTEIINDYDGITATNTDIPFKTVKDVIDNIEALKKSQDMANGRNVSEMPFITLLGQCRGEVSSASHANVAVSLRVISGTLKAGDQVVISAITRWHDTKNLPHREYIKRKHKTLYVKTITQADLDKRDYVEYGILTFKIDETANFDKLNRTYSKSGDRNNVKYIRIRRDISKPTEATTYVSTNHIPVRLNVFEVTHNVSFTVDIGSY